MAQKRKNFDSKRGINLDVGCGNKKQHGFVGMDKRELPGVDIVWDLEKFPYPVDDNDCLVIVASHIVEHIKPWLTIPMFDELWRIMKPGGQLAIVTPYAGSPGYWADPTHCNGFTENTFLYFDHRHQLYGTYSPKPWEIQPGSPSWQVNGTIEVIMRKAEHVAGR